MNCGGAWSGWVLVAGIIPFCDVFGIDVGGPFGGKLVDCGGCCCCCKCDGIGGPDIGGPGRFICGGWLVGGGPNADGGPDWMFEFGGGLVTVFIDVGGPDN